MVTLSMGGLPSRAWGEAVDKAYEAGICICAAAGNHVGVAPPRTLVYPARYSRVIAVCGVMADGRPYAGLTGTALEGSFGPDSAMKAAIAAYTPNIPWARFGCAAVVRLQRRGHVGRHAAGGRRRRALVREVQERAAARLAARRGGAQRALHLGQA